MNGRAVLVSLLLGGAVLAGCKNTETVSPAANPYEGNWMVTHVVTASDGACSDTVGTVATDGPFTIDASGHFTLPGDDSPPYGTVSAAGVVAFTIPGDQGGGSCPSGSGSGACANADSCAGTYVQGSSEAGTWVLVRAR